MPAVNGLELGLTAGSLAKRVSAEGVRCACVDRPEIQVLYSLQLWERPSHYSLTDLQFYGKLGDWKRMISSHFALKDDVMVYMKGTAGAGESER